MGRREAPAEDQERRASGRQAQEELALRNLKVELHRRVLQEMTAKPDWGRQEAREMALRIIDNELAVQRPTLRRGSELQNLIEALLNDIFGLGAIQPLVDDPSVSEIMVNGPDQIYVERNGRIYPTKVHFDGVESEMTVIERMVGTVGRRVDESTPMADARLPDGSRVNVVLPPLVLGGPVVTIRKFRLKLFDVDELVEVGAATKEMFAFLEAAVRGRQNILVTGGSSSGKTTLLNLLSGFIGSGERIVTIEDAVELKLRQEHVVTMETRPPNAEGRGTVTMRDLVRNALRMRPDRIVVGEVRGPEALDMIQAMSTDHDGGMSTLHANSSRDALQRLETMVMMAGLEIPVEGIRSQIGSAIGLVVHTERVSGGARKIVEVSEVERAGSTVAVKPIFTYLQTGVDKEGNAVGRHTSSGQVPDCAASIRAHGVVVEDRWFRTPGAAAKPTKTARPKSARAKRPKPVKTATANLARGKAARGKPAKGKPSGGRSRR